MNDSGSQVTTTRNDPPAYVLPQLQHAAGQSRELYDQGPQQYFPGDTVTPFSGETEQALGMQTTRAQNGSPVNRAASGYTADVLGGKYLNANPYIDATFNQAAQGTRSQLDSQFARGGRNLGASEAARADQLNNLATQIYGGNYANERAMQGQTLGMAPGIANQDYVDAAQLGQVGQQREDLTSRHLADQISRYDFAQNAPGINLDQYIARLNNQPGGSSTATVPYTQNRAAGGLGGAAAVYGMTGNPWLAGAGGLLGAFG